MGLHVKAWLKKRGGDNSESEVRLFTVQPAEIDNYAAFATKIHQVFPTLGGKIFNIYWKDDDNDEVSISNDQELADALACATSGVFRVTVTPRDGGNAKLHPNVICDGCEERVRGTRYKCCLCPDYDLCEECENKGVHQMHDMIAIRQPGPGSSETPRGVNILLPLLRANRVFKPHGVPGRRCGSNTRHCFKGPYGTNTTCLPNGPWGPQEDSQGCDEAWGPHGLRGPHGPHGHHGSCGPQKGHGPWDTHGPYGPHNPHGPHGPWGAHGTHGPHGPHNPHGPHGPWGHHEPHGPNGLWGLPLPLGLFGSWGPHSPHGPHGPCEPHDRHRPHGPWRRCCKQTNNETKVEGERSDTKKNDQKAPTAKPDNGDTCEAEVEPEEFLNMLGETVAFNLEHLGVLFGMDVDKYKDGKCCHKQPPSGQSTERDGKPGTDKKNDQKAATAKPENSDTCEAEVEPKELLKLLGETVAFNLEPLGVLFGMDVDKYKDGKCCHKQPPSGQTTERDGKPGAEEKLGQSPGKPQSEQEITTDQNDVQLKEANVLESRNSPSQHQVKRSPLIDGATVGGDSDRTEADMMNTTSQNSDDQGWSFIGDQAVRPKTSKLGETSEDKTQSSHRRADTPITDALAKMTAMGFSDDGGWLTRLLEAKHGDINSVLEVIRPQKPE